MSVMSRVGPPAAEYFRGQAPSWSSIQTGLSIFALFIIARFCLQKAYSWLRVTERHRPLPSPSSIYHHQRDPKNHILLPRFQPHSWPLDDKSPHPWASFGGMTSPGQSLRVDDAAAASMDVQRSSGSNRLSPMAARPFISRPPPAPPLTPPELSGAVFGLEERRQADHESLIHQPNPDYMSSTSTSSFQADHPPESFIPRRRSYTRSLPMSGPIRPGQQQAMLDLRGNEQPSSPVSLAGPVEGSHHAHSMTGGHDAGSAHDGQSNGSFHHGSISHRNVDVQGEIISVLDREGAGWTRHTRVYGGGACLACAASGGGGFYGATVTPEEMR